MIILNSILSWVFCFFLLSMIFPYIGKSLFVFFVALLLFSGGMTVGFFVAKSYFKMYPEDLYK